MSSDPTHMNNIEYPTIKFDTTVYINLAAMFVVLIMCITTMCHYYAKLQRNYHLQTDGSPVMIQLPSMSNITPCDKLHIDDNSIDTDRDELPSQKQYDHLKPPEMGTVIKYSKDRINSISGPERGSVYYTAFIVTLTIMIVCGSCNDFLGKLIYQIFPGNDHSLHGIDALKGEYWITFLLTVGSFAICSVAIFTESAKKSYHKLDRKLFLKIFVPSVMDFFVTGGRYLGLVFLSGAVVSIMKNGTQLLFLALLRRCFHKKMLKWTQLFGIIITMCGLFLVALEKFAASLDDNGSLKDSVIGVTIMLIVGFMGAIRNDIEELLLKNDNLEPNFVVRILLSLSRDNLIPYFDYFSITNADGEPIRAYIACYIIALGCIFIGHLNIVAPLITQFFVGTYAFISGWGPSFIYYNKYTALLGGIICIGIMLFINIEYAVVAIIIAGIIYEYIAYNKPNVNWGSAFASRAKWKANDSSLRLYQYGDHVKNFQPSFLVLCKNNIFGRHTNVNNIKTQSLIEYVLTLRHGFGTIVYSTVLLGTFDEYIGMISNKSLQHRPLAKKKAAFYEQVVSNNVRHGARLLMQLCGIGRLRTNTVVLGWKTNWIVHVI